MEVVGLECYRFPDEPYSIDPCSLLLLFGGGGFILEVPQSAVGGLALSLLIRLVVYLMGGFRSRKLTDNVADSAGEQSAQPSSQVASDGMLRIYR